MNRVKIICLIIFLLSLGTMGCVEDDPPDCGFYICTEDGFPGVFPFFLKECNADEYICAGECTPMDIDCCIDSFGDEVGSCPEENPFCCEEYDL